MHSFINFIRIDINKIFGIKSNWKKFDRTTEFSFFNILWPEIIRNDFNYSSQINAGLTSKLSAVETFLPIESIES